MSVRKYVAKDIVERIAIKKYRENGLGITFEDIERECSVNKRKGQRKLKYLHKRNALFTANDLILEGINDLQNTSPQRYFPICIKSKIVEDLIKRKNVPVDPTGVNHSSSPFSSFAALNNTDQIILQTLEGHILRLLPASPSFIHNIHLNLTMISECYGELSVPTTSGNKGKKSTHIFSKSRVDYTFYPSGTVNIEVSCSNHPFKLQTEEDRSRMLVFFGQLRQVLISILMDTHERIVPDVLEWEITQCDLNKDTKVSDWFQLIEYKVQVKHLDHLFRIYIKSMGEETVARVEESLHPKKSAIETIHNIFNPIEKVEKQIAVLSTKISAVYDMVSKLGGVLASNHKLDDLVR